MGYKQFVAGEEALAGDVNSYLMSQTVARFTTAAQRTSLLSSPVLNQLSMLDSQTGTIDYWNGTAWVPLLGAWNAYTPVWAGSIGNPSLGNSAVVARYKVTGKMVQVYAKINFGSTMNGGAGNLTLSTPPGLDPATAGMNVGTCDLYIPSINLVVNGLLGASGGGKFGLYFPVSNSACYAQAWKNADSGGAAGNSLPQVVGGYCVQVGGVVTFSAQYEIA